MKKSAEKITNIEIDSDKTLLSLLPHTFYNDLTKMRLISNFSSSSHKGFRFIFSSPENFS